jgi:hypothetical protein
MLKLLIVSIFIVCILSFLPNQLLNSRKYKNELNQRNQKKEKRINVIIIGRKKENDEISTIKNVLNSSWLPNNISIIVLNNDQIDDIQIKKYFPENFRQILVNPDHFPTSDYSLLINTSTILKLNWDKLLQTDLIKCFENGGHMISQFLTEDSSLMSTFPILSLKQYNKKNSEYCFEAMKFAVMNRQYVIPVLSPDLLFGPSQFIEMLLLDINLWEMSNKAYLKGFVIMNPLQSRARRKKGRRETRLKLCKETPISKNFLVKHLGIDVENKRIASRAFFGLLDKPTIFEIVHKFKSQKNYQNMKKNIITSN